LTENSPELLSTVAESISDGAAIEWELIAQQLAAEDSDLLPELKLLEQIARFHRAAVPGGADDSSIYEQPVRDSHPKTWRHLLIIGPIGSGSCADVYRAHDTKLQRDVALKLIRVEETRGSEPRVLKDARRLARARHTNLVSVLGAAEVSGRVGFWMELVRGTTLEERLAEGETFDAHEASRIGLDVCRALAVLHRAGLVHDGIRARNVMRDERGRFVLMDCGSGMVAGSSRTKSDDIRAVAVLLFHLVTRRYPVEGQTYLHTLRPDLPNDFVTIVEGALDADPRKRFHDAAAFERALAGLLGEPAEHASGGPGRMLSDAFSSMVARLRGLR